MGLDLSLAGTGAVLLGSGTVRWRFIPTKRINELPKRADSQLYNGRFYGTTEERITWIMLAVLEEWARSRPDIVVIEEYAFSRHSRSLTPLHELGGVMKHYLGLVDALWVPLVRDAAMVYGCAHNKASKELSIERSIELGFTRCPNGDVADAFHLARYGLHKYDELVELAAEI
jgi:hypothetical protein